jgi:hypothetical protein
MAVDPYDRKAWEEIHAHHARKPTRRVREAVPKRVREKAGALATRGKDKAEVVFDGLPGAEQIEEALETALHGLTRSIGTTAAASVVTPLVLRRYSRRNYPVTRIEDIRELDLSVSDAVFPRRKRVVYMTGSIATGAWAGVVTTAGEVGAVAGGVAGVGAGATPGAMTVIGAFAADAAATLLTSSRVVAETSALYGYDPNDPAEQLFMAGVLGAATAGTQAGKAAAQRELHALAQALAINAPWTILNQNHITRIVAKVYKKLGERLTKQQLGKAVPALGIAVGAGSNGALMLRVADEAYFAYRERRLRERYGDDAAPVVPVNASPTGPTAALGALAAPEDPSEPEETLDIIELADEAVTELHERRNVLTDPLTASPHRSRESPICSAREPVQTWADVAGRPHNP